MDDPLQRPVAEMAALCARAEYCTSEIRRRLRRYELDSEQTDEVIRRLTEGAYIDDQRYARAYIRTHLLQNGWGRRKAAFMLSSQKAISASVVREAMEAVSEDEYLAAARKVLASRRRGLDLTDYDTRLRLMRHLASRGYESDLIRSLLNEE